MLPAWLVTDSVIRACVAVLAGVLAPQLISFPLRSGLLIALLSISALVLLTRARRELLFAGAGAAAFLWAMDGALDAQLDRAIEGDSLLADVRVVDFPRRHGRLTRFEAVTIDHPLLPRRLDLRWHEPPVPVRFGDIWRLELRLKSPRGASNPGGRDAAARALERRIQATGYVANGRHNRLADSGVLAPVDRLRVALAARIDRSIADPGSAAVITAVGIGARHRLTPEQWQRYAASGTSHLVAISGLHVGLAAASAYLACAWLLGVAGLRRNATSWATGLALAVALGYALLSGFAVPAQRASLMLLLASLAALRCREVEGFRVLALAALAVSVWDPLATLSAGFRLSFAAVAILLIVARHRLAPAGHRLLAPLVAARRLGLAQLALFCGLLPVTALSFGQVSLSAPLINLVAVPAFGLVTVPLTLAGLALGGPFEAAGDALLGVAGASVALLERAIGAASGATASRAIPSVGGCGMLLLLLPLAWLLAPPGLPGRAVAWLACLGVLCYRPPSPPQGCARITVLDVGQGLAATVETARHTMLYDTGPAFRGGGSSATSVVLPFLRHRGVSRIDRLVVSHPDSDHAGGVDDILSSLPVGRFVAGGAAQDERLAGPCTSGDGWQWDGVRFEFLHPPPGGAGEGNDGSCVLLIAAGDRRALLTGDIEASGERALVQAARLPPVDLLVVPHHGSRTSSTAPFVAATRPTIAVVSAGYRNRWGLPAADVVARWRAAGAQVVDTAGWGAIAYTICGDGPEGAVDGHRRSNSRPWHTSRRERERERP